jgi:predicted transport protein
MQSIHSEYTIESHFQNGRLTTKELFNEFVSKVQKIDSRVSLDPKKKYIGLKIGNKVAVAISPLQSKLKLQLYRVEPTDLNDPNQKVKYKTNSFEDFNKHISYFDISTKQDVDYGLDLTKQVLDKFFSRG